LEDSLPAQTIKKKKATERKCGGVKGRQEKRGGKKLAGVGHIKGGINFKDIREKEKK